MDPRRYVMELNDGNIIPLLGFGTAAPIEVNIVFLGLNVKMK